MIELIEIHIVRSHSKGEKTRRDLVDKRPVYTVTPNPGPLRKADISIQLLTCGNVFSDQCNCFT